MILFALPIEGSSSSLPQIVHLDVSKGSKKLGTEDYEFRPVGKDEREIKIVLHLSQNNLILTAKSIYDMKGKWLSKSMKIELGTQTVIGNAQLTADGADVDAPSPTGRFKHILQPPSGLSLLDPTVEWWRTVKPSPGTTATFAYFDLEKVMWEKTTFTYIGDKIVTINGKSIKAHEVKQVLGPNTTDYYYDDSGDPVLINGGTHFEMTSKSPDKQFRTQ